MVSLSERYGCRLHPVWNHFWNNLNIANLFVLFLFFFVCLFDDKGFAKMPHPYLK